MEERVLDDEEGRGIKLKRTKNGETDAVDALAEGEENAEEEIFIELPEEEYDDDLVGLTPTQLKEELARRAKLRREAREESEKLTAAGAEKLAAGEFPEAELLYAQALVLDGDNDGAREGLWTSRTKNFSDEEPLFAEGVPQELGADERARAFVVGKIGETLQTLRDSYTKEEAEIAPDFEKKQRERREAFAANRKYYLVRFAVFFILGVLFCIGAGVSASFLLRTQSDTPFILIGVFGGLALAALVVAVIYARKLYVASGLYRANEKLSSTETGARIFFLRERIEAINVMFGEDGSDETAPDEEEPAEE